MHFRSSSAPYLNSTAGNPLGSTAFSSFKRAIDNSNFFIARLWHVFSSASIQNRCRHLLVLRFHYLFAGWGSVLFINLVYFGYPLLDQLSVSYRRCSDVILYILFFDLFVVVLCFLFLSYLDHICFFILQFIIGFYLL